MRIRQHLGPDFPRRKATYNRESDGPFEFIQRLMRKAAASRGSNAALGEFQMIALADSPRLERIFWQDDSKGVADTAHRQFHCLIITSYNRHFNRQATPARNLRTHGRGATIAAHREFAQYRAGAALRGPHQFKKGGLSCG